MYSLVVMFFFFFCFFFFLFFFFFCFFFFFVKDAINRVTKYREKKVTSPVSSCSALNSPGARADLPPLELFLDPLLVVTMQLINFGAIIPIIHGYK